MIDDLLTLARTYCAAEGVGLHGLSKRSHLDKFFVRLAAGKPCRPATAARALAWLAANWPAELPWPEGISRPEMTAVEAVKEETMPVIFEESPEQLAARLEDEEADRVFRQRLEMAERERRVTAGQLREAMALVERAPPSLTFDLQCQRAVQDCDLRAQGREPPPSLGGLTRFQMDDIARRQEVAERAAASDRAARQRWLTEHEQSDVIAKLCAGQTEENQRAIRAAFKAAGGF